jgi:Mannosyltransferase (PIG-V)
VTSALNSLRKILSSESVGSAAFAFTVSRAIVLVVFIFGTSIKLKEPIVDFGTRVQDIDVSISTNLKENLQRGISAADSLWHIGIARDGYERIPFDARGEHNWAFFPLFPVLLRGVGKLTGEFALTGAILSSVLFFFALYFLNQTALEFGQDSAAADRTTFYIATFPTSYFFSFPVGESLFLLITVTTILAAKRDRWWLAGVLGGFASGTRFLGVLLVPVLLILYYQRYGLKIKVRLLAIPLVLAGLLAYMWHLHNITGNPLAFSHVQAAWNRHSALFYEPLLAYLSNAGEVSFGWNFILLNFLAALLALGAGLVLLKQRQWALALYTLASILIPLSYPASPLQSTTRYVMSVFPVFMVLGSTLKSSRSDQAIRALFIALLSLMTFLYSIHFSPAMS